MTEWRGGKHGLSDESLPVGVAQGRSPLKEPVAGACCATRREIYRLLARAQLTLQGGGWQLEQGQRYVRSSCSHCFMRTAVESVSKNQEKCAESTQNTSSYAHGNLDWGSIGSRMWE